MRLSSKLRFTLLAAIALLALVLGYLVAALISPSPPLSQPTQTLSLDGSFNLIDEAGQPVTQDSYEGKFKLVYFGFTYCPDVCPMQLEVVSHALDIAKISPEWLTTLFITLDPERDTPEDMKIYTDNFHKSIIGLTGSLEQIQQAAKAYKVYFQKVADPETTGGYTVDHSSIVFLMGPDNTYKQHFTHRDSAEDIAGKITSIIKAAQN
ncbi:MAG: hypothetical protein CBE09_00995 [Rhizobiales bacterium TMED249]|uniref:SCO family protein n=1 Tax=PS1 clade bacterium TaxID=2175152 RepID=A0A368E2Z6_9PROT|nr:MAG: hypothetical protein CBE09_00995 [Rhizobiales bacterium TMED249]RCL78470.1 MAG: SCO family protein [PS1 clade bacterium]HAK97848.1 SCO family protein [Rhodobiaceae bacterium]HCV48634.1 SCO family protein [Rhodobiaceae bacterium]